MESNMTKLLLALFMTAIVTVGGVLMWKAEATPLAGAASSLAVAKSYSAVEKAGCMFGTHRCPAGTKWACVKHPATPGKSCICRPC